MSLIHWYNDKLMPHDHKSMIQNFTIGFVSGAVIGGIKSSAQTDRDNTQKIKESFKTAMQSAVAASMIADANHKLMHNNHLGALVSFGVGAIGIYAIEKISQKDQTEVKEDAQSI